MIGCCRRRAGSGRLAGFGLGWNFSAGGWNEITDLVVGRCAWNVLFVGDGVLDEFHVWCAVFVRHFLGIVDGRGVVGEGGCEVVLGQGLGIGRKLDGSTIAVAFALQEIFLVSRFYGVADCFLCRCGGGEEKGRGFFND